jgi:DNA damage-binding protein 1
MKAAGRIDPNGSRYLLGDHLGRVYVLVLTNDGQRVSDLKLEVIGEVRNLISFK